MLLLLFNKRYKVSIKTLKKFNNKKFSLVFNHVTVRYTPYRPLSLDTQF